MKGSYQELQKNVSFEYLLSPNNIKGIRSIEVIYDKKEIGVFSSNLFSILFPLKVNMNYQGERVPQNCSTVYQFTKQEGKRK